MNLPRSIESEPSNSIFKYRFGPSNLCLARVLGRVRQNKGNGNRNRNVKFLGNKSAVILQESQDPVILEGS